MCRLSYQTCLCSYFVLLNVYLRNIFRTIFRHLLFLLPDHAPKSYFSMGLISKTTVSSRKKVIFDRVISDSGHFNHVTGEYVAPYFGTYEFNYHGLADKSDILYLDLYRNYK